MMIKYSLTLKLISLYLSLSFRPHNRIVFHCEQAVYFEVIQVFAKTEGVENGEVYLFMQEVLVL